MLALGEFANLYENAYVELALKSGDRFRVYVRSVGRDWVLVDDGTYKLIINKTAIAYIKIIRRNNTKLSQAAGGSEVLSQHSHHY